MSASLVAKISLLLSSTLTVPNGSVSVSDQKIDRSVPLSFLTGVGAGLADLIYAETRTIAASGNAALDLAGVLLDAFGNVITFARIKAILIIASAANTNDVLLGGAGSNTFIGPFADATDIVRTRPGGITVLACNDATGWPVTAATADQLKVANSGGTTGVTFDLVLIGASA